MPDCRTPPRSFPPLQRVTPSQICAALAYVYRQEPSAFLVGGWLRDALQGIASRDLDVVVRGDPFMLARAAADRCSGAYVPLHVSPHIARVVLQANGDQWTMDLSMLQGSLEDDLARRDFTVNTLALPLVHVERPWTPEEVTDPYDGLRDLREGTVRAVSSDVFRHDPVRLLRAVRLTGLFNMRVARETLGLMKRDAALVTQAPGERIRDELVKILDLPFSFASVRFMDDLGLLSHLIPELEGGRHVSQPPEHYWDVREHNLQTVDAVDRLLSSEARRREQVLAPVPWYVQLEDHFAAEIVDGAKRSVWLKLAGLLHDIGKPATRTVEPSGRIRFLGHHEIGAEMAVDVLRRLRASGRATDLVTTMIRYHLRPGQLSQHGEAPTRRAVYRYYRDTGNVALDTLYLNLADYLAARGPLLDGEGWGARCRAVAMVLRAMMEEETTRPPRLIDGHVLMRELGLSPGPLIGKLLELVREAQAEGAVASEEEALELASRYVHTMSIEAGAAAFLGERSHDGGEQRKGK